MPPLEWTEEHGGLPMEKGYDLFMPTIYTTFQTNSQIHPVRNQQENHIRISAS
jgi:hypothetical protein